MISAVVLTKNEERNIKECLKTLSWCDQILVIDDHSQDKTTQIAKKMGAEVFLHPLKGGFAAQRNYGLEKAKGNWVLFVDADERISAALTAEIKSQISNLKSQSHNLKLKTDKPVGFFLKRKDFIFGKWLKHGEAGRMKLLRLAKRGAGQWRGAVHETWEVEGKKDTLKNTLLHYPHPDTASFLKNIDFYSTIRADELYHRGERAHFLAIIIYPMGKFFKNFFYCLGFWDGLPGFLHAVLMSFHSFLVRGKLYFLGINSDAEK